MVVVRNTLYLRVVGGLVLSHQYLMFMYVLGLYIFIYSVCLHMPLLFTILLILYKSDQMDTIQFLHSLHYLPSSSYIVYTIYIHVIYFHITHLSSAIQNLWETDLPN
jgi:hypothetical protein